MPRRAACREHRRRGSRRFASAPGMLCVEHLAGLEVVDRTSGSPPRKTWRPSGLKTLVTSTPAPVQRQDLSTGGRVEHVGPIGDFRGADEEPFAGLIERDPRRIGGLWVDRDAVWRVTSSDASRVASNTATVRSWETAARSRPSGGWKATPVTAVGNPVIDRTTRAVSSSQILPSGPDCLSPETLRPGENPGSWTGPSCPASTRTSAPDCESHSRTFRSLAAIASSRPSGLNLTLLPGLRVPQGP